LGDLSYYLGNGAILIPALVTLSNLRIKDPFFFHRVLISIGVIISFLFRDILFINYAGNFGADVLYNIGYICFALALIWYYKISQLLNKNLDQCLLQGDKMVKSVEKFIEKDNPETNDLEYAKGVIENINDPNKAYQYLRRVLKDAKNGIHLLLSPIAINLIVKEEEVYDVLIEKAKDPNMIVRFLIPYDKANEISISKLNQESKNHIKVEYTRKLNILNQILLIVDNKFVLNLTIGKNNSKEDIKSAMYSSKESVVLCYTTMIEYQSLISDI
jgi:hypothetical protein